MVEAVDKARADLIENAIASSNDETLLEKWIEDSDSLSIDEIKTAIKKAVLAADFYLVSGGDGRGVIVEKVLDLVVDYLPSPLDNSGIVGVHPKTGESVLRTVGVDQPLSALAFKIATDPFVGRLCFVRVYSGVLKSGSNVFNVSTGKKLRIGRLVRMFADKREEIDQVTAGDIAAVIGLKDTVTGNTLADAGQPILLEAIEFADPPVSIAIEPATKPDQEKMSLALKRLAEEDPTFRVTVDQENQSDNRQCDGDSLFRSNR